MICSEGWGIEQEKEMIYREEYVPQWLEGLADPAHINTLAKAVHEDNRAVGWWDNPNRDVYECLQLIVTEIAEATEAARKGLMDDKLPHLPGEAVEVADANIRLLDLAGHLGLTFEYSDFYAEEVVADYPWGKSVGGDHFLLTRSVVTFGEAVEYTEAVKGSPEGEHHVEFIEELLNGAYTRAMLALLYFAGSKGYPIWDIVEEKRAFNAKREDHKREHRAKEGGKKF